MFLLMCIKNIMKDSPFDMIEGLIEIGKHFQGRSLTLKFLAYLLEINIGLSAKSS